MNFQQPQYQTFSQTRFQQPYIPNLTQTQNSMIWVQGIEGAKSYQIMPSSLVVLFDSEIEGRFYIKSSDNIGMCSMRYFNFSEINNPQLSNTDMSQYITKEQVLELIKSEMKGGKTNVKPVISTNDDVASSK